MTAFSLRHQYASLKIGKGASLEDSPTAKVKTVRYIYASKAGSSYTRQMHTFQTNGPCQNNTVQGHGTNHSTVASCLSTQLEPGRSVRTQPVGAHLRPFIFLCSHSSNMWLDNNCCYGCCCAVVLSILPATAIVASHSRTNFEENTNFEERL